MTIRLASNIALFAALCAGVSGADAGPLAYISNYDDNTVSVIDTASDQVVGQFPSLSGGSLGPWAVAINPEGTEVYFSHPFFGLVDKVAVIGTQQPHVINDVTVGHGALGIAFDPAGEWLYQANAEDGSISVIHATDKSVTNWPLGLSWPLGVATTTVKGKIRVYVTENQGAQVAVIDPAGQRVVKRIPVGEAPVGIAINAAGTRAYVANFNDNSVSVINTINNRVVDLIPVGRFPNGIAVDPSGKRVYVANLTTVNPSAPETGSVSIINTRANRVIRTVRVGKTPYGVGVTPDGNKVYVTNQGGGNVSVINASLKRPKVIKTVPVGKSPIAFGLFIH
jgi:YVTN family beta-propeller protein